MGLCMRRSFDTRAPAAGTARLLANGQKTPLDGRVQQNLAVERRRVRGRVDGNAPLVLTETLLRAAATSSKGVIYLRADGSPKEQSQWP